MRAFRFLFFFLVHFASLVVPPRYFFLPVLCIFSFSLALYCRFFDGKQRADVGINDSGSSSAFRVSFQRDKERKKEKERGVEKDHGFFLFFEKKDLRKKRRPAQLKG